MGINLGKLLDWDEDCSHVFNPQGDLIQTALGFLPVAGAIGGAILGFIVPLPQKDKLIVGASLGTAGYFLGRGLYDSDPNSPKYMSAALGAGGVALLMGVVDIENTTYVLVGAGGGALLGYEFLSPIVAPVTNIGHGVLGVTKIFGIGTRGVACIVGKIKQDIRRDVEYDFRDCTQPAPSACSCWQKKYPNYAWRERAGDLCIGVPCFQPGSPQTEWVEPAECGSDVVIGGTQKCKQYKESHPEITWIPGIAPRVPGDWDGKARALWKPNCVAQRSVDKLVRAGADPDSCYCHEGDYYSAGPHSSDANQHWRHVFTTDEAGKPTCRVVSWQNTQQALLKDPQEITYKSPCNFSDAEYDAHIATMEQNVKGVWMWPLTWVGQWTNQFSSPEWQNKAEIVYHRGKLLTKEQQREWKTYEEKIEAEYKQKKAALDDVTKRWRYSAYGGVGNIPPEAQKQIDAYAGYLNAWLQAMMQKKTPPKVVRFPQGPIGSIPVRLLPPDDCSALVEKIVALQGMAKSLKGRFKKAAEAEIAQLRAQAKMKGCTVP